MNDLKIARFWFKKWLSAKEFYLGVDAEYVRREALASWLNELGGLASVW